MQVSDEQQPKPPEALSYVPPVQGSHQDAALPPAPSQIQRLGIAGIALHAPGNRLARRRPPRRRPPRLSSTHPTQNRISPGRHPSGPSATGRRSLWTPASSGLADPSRPRAPGVCSREVMTPTAARDRTRSAEVCYTAGLNNAGCATRLRRQAKEERRGPDPSWSRWKAETTAARSVTGRA